MNAWDWGVLIMMIALIIFFTYVAFTERKDQ